MNKSNDKLIDKKNNNISKQGEKKIRIKKVTWFQKKVKMRKKINAQQISREKKYAYKSVGG